MSIEELAPTIVGAIFAVIAITAPWWMQTPLGKPFDSAWGAVRNGIEWAIRPSSRK